MAQGEFPNWADPYTTEFAIGADIATFQAQVSSLGDDVELVKSYLSSIRDISGMMRRSMRHAEEEISALTDSNNWFDDDAMDELKPALQVALCLALGERVRAASGAEAKVDTFHAIHTELQEYRLYPDCLAQDIRLMTARSMRRIERAQDALPLVERDEDGNIMTVWWDIYIEGRFALTLSAVTGQDIRQFRPGIESLNELKEYSSDDARFNTLRDNLLTALATRVETLVSENTEMDAFDLTLLVREKFADHPQVVRASSAAAQGLIAYGIRAAAADRPIRANNAYVRGLEHFSGIDSWEENVESLRIARGNAFVSVIRESIDEGRLEDALDLWDEADGRNLLDEDSTAQIAGMILSGQWTEVETRIENGEFRSAFGLSQALLEEAQDIDVLGGRMTSSYEAIAEGIWTRYGYVTGAFAGENFNIALTALEHIRTADDTRAEYVDEMTSKINTAEWIGPVLFLVLLILMAGLFWILRPKSPQFEDLDDDE
jgi:hypothetical protein